MDIFENIFQRILRFKKNPIPKNEIRLVDISKAVESLAAAFWPNVVSKKVEALQIHGSRDFVGVLGSAIFLPEKIDLFSEENENRKLYIYLLLLICGSGALENKGIPQKNKSASAARWDFLLRMPEINIYLDTQFSGFYSFQFELIDKIKSQIHKDNAKDEFFLNWYKLSLSRVIGTATIQNPTIGYKANRKTPGYLFNTVPCLEFSQIGIKKEKNYKIDLKQRSSEIKTVIKKTYSSVVDRVDINKEAPNPVTHSFEKLETADEYNGGRRFDSGDDELNDHAAALDELNLSSVTTGGEAAQSAYQPEGYFSTESADAELNNMSIPKYFTYPEWNAKRFSYMQNYCRIIENSPLTTDQMGLVGTNKNIENIKNEHKQQISHWQKRIANLLTTPLWLKRLKDGDDLDYDEFVRDYILLKNKQNVDGRWYMQRKPRLKNAAVVMLVDQSWSSDAYIKNHRVLDIIKDSIVVTGILFDQVIDYVSVVGTWSSTRHNCIYHEYKSGRQSWSAYFNEYENIQPQGYTRLGPALRHATKILLNLPAEKKLLLILTDGKPTDLDGYEGTQGVQDVKFACLEAESQGILPYAMTIDENAKQHFPKMFKHYILLSDLKNISEEIFNALIRLINGKI